MKPATIDVHKYNHEISYLRIVHGEYVQVELAHSHGDPTTKEIVELLVEPDGTFTIYSDIPVKPWSEHPAHFGEEGE